MTVADLRAWQAAMGFAYESAAEALGMSRSGYAKLVTGACAIERRTALACAAIAAGLQVWTAASWIPCTVPVPCSRAWAP